jgi:AcrR family transcriptional regulator
MSRWPAKEQMQARILETADRLFYGRGIRAIGVEAVASQIGISKRTLYNHYPSKDALIAAYLSRRLIELKITDQPPLEQILGVFDGLERSVASGRFRGCPFVNAVAELGQEVREANKLALAFKERRRLWFRELLSRLDVADANGVATQLSLVLDGAIATSLVRADPAFVRAARDAAATLIEAGTRETKHRRFRVR